MTTVPISLTIAGSDSGGGAGIQADLRTFAMHCVHGMSAVTCITAQNTLGVSQVVGISPEMVTAQIEAIMSDIGTKSAKTGMLLNVKIMEAVAEQIQKWSIQPLVVDPVMVSRTGAKLIDDTAIDFLQHHLIPQASVVTPNRYEAQLLAKCEINCGEDMEKAAKIIYEQAQCAVLVKGGGMKDSLRGIDFWFDGKEMEILQTETVKTRHTHGTGCTLSAAIAANLAQGKDLLSAVKQAKHYVTDALRFSLSMGQGTGPVGHFYPLLERCDTKSV